MDQPIAIVPVKKKRKKVKPPGGFHILAPSAGSGGSTGTHHGGGGSSTPSPGISDFGKTGGGRSSGGGAPSVTIPVSSGGGHRGGGYAVPSTVPASHASTGGSRTPALSAADQARIQAVQSLAKAQKQIKKLAKSDRVKIPKPPKLHKLKVEPIKDVKLARTLSSQVKAKQPKPGTTDAHVLQAARRVHRYAQVKLPEAKLGTARAPKIPVAAKAKPKAAAKGAKLDKSRAAKLIHSLDRPFKPGEQIPAHQAALLAEAVGLPGRTYAQIAKGESTLQPGAVSNDGGYGLWQMTPRVQSAATRAKWEQIASRHKGGYLNPVANARMAKVLAGGSTGVSNYYGTGYVTNADAHVRGGQPRARKILGKPAKAASAPKQLPGRWEGARAAVAKGIKGIAVAKGGKRTPAENAAVGGSPTSDHLTTNKSTYAQDIPATGSQGTAIFNKVAKNLGIKATPGSYDWYTSPKAPGYRFQILWQVEGHFDHVHVGAEWQGSSAVATTSTGTTTSVGGTTTSGTTSMPVSGSTYSSDSTSSTRDNRAALLRELERNRKRAAKKIGTYRQSLTTVTPTPKTSTPSSSPSSGSIQLGL